MYTQFFIPMQPPTTTHNAKQLHAYMKGGKPCAVLHDSPELKATRAKLHAYLASHAPKAPIPAGQPVRLLVKWCFPTEGKRRSGEWRTSKPDTDNLEKAFERLRLDELATLQTDATHTTQRFSPVPGGSGDGQALPRSVERIDEARRAAEAQSAVCDAIRAEIMEVFRQLDDEVDFMILFRRYILLEDWPDIAVSVRISRSQMFQRHSAAIKRLEIKSPD